MSEPDDEIERIYCAGCERQMPLDEDGYHVDDLDQRASPLKCRALLERTQHCEACAAGLPLTEDGLHHVEELAPQVYAYVPCKAANFTDEGSHPAATHPDARRWP